MVIVCLGLWPATSEGFQTDTHRAMNEEAARKAAPGGFQLDSFLKQDLGSDFTAGIATPFNDLSVTWWLAEGGKREDDWTPVPGGPIGRFNRHFHDPLRSWDDAGLQLFPLAPRFDSSVVWMQWDDGVDASEASADGQAWSWPDVRRAYYHALTLEAKKDRDQKWADTFRGIGQMMHLVEDSAVPEHVRNDPHPLGHFEGWVNQHLDDGGFSLDPSVANTRFDRSIMYQPTGYGEAPVSIARLIDTDTYECNPPPQLGPNCDPSLTLNAGIGLAEFTNANFFSEDTVPGPYPHPDVARVQPSERIDTTTTLGYRRRYFRKGDGDGIAFDPAMVERVYDQLFLELDGRGTVALEEVLIDRSTDKYIWAAIASKVVPKAVDYAQGVLEYFFRGRFDFCHGGSGGFSAIRNTGPEALHGVFELYYDDASGTRVKLGEWRTEDSLPPSAEGWLFPGDALRVRDGYVPSDPPPTAYIVVFHGDMGSEVQNPDDPASVGAVAAKVIDASQQCEQTLWQSSQDGSIVAYDIGPDGVPTGVSGSIGVPTTSGVAFDPTDGNLWYTTTWPIEDGMLHKITPDGAPVTAIEVVGTLVEDLTGEPQRDFSAIDMDPDDPHFIWVSGLMGLHVIEHEKGLALYKVRTSDGQVVQTCVVTRLDWSGSDANHLLAAVKLGSTTVLVTALDTLGWDFNHLSGFDAETCASIGVWDVLPLPDPVEWCVGTAAGIAGNGVEEWVMALWINDNEDTSFYRFAPDPWGSAVLDQPLATSPSFPESGSDIALGVGPGCWPQATP
jgi:hypothetical protein